MPRAALSVRDRIYILYDRTENLWHERLLTAPLAGSRWVVATPTNDVHEEDIEEAEDWMPGGPRGGPPPALRLRPVFRFTQLSKDDIEDFVVEGQRMANEILDAEAPPAVLAPAAPAQLPLQAGAGARPAQRLRGKQAPPGAAEAAGGEDAEVWCATEDRGSFKAGEVVQLDGLRLVRMGDRGVVCLDGGVSLGVALVDTFRMRPSAVGALDLRILAVRKDAAGARARDWKEAVECFTETPQQGWVIKGPRTTLWLVKAIRAAGFTPVQRHYWWRSILGLAAGDMGVDEHHFLSEAMERATVFDQLNLPELESYEGIARRYQMWEEIYSSALKQAEVGEDQGDWLDERRIFLGADRSKGHALVCPELELHVASKLAAESAVLKERRKAKEERQAARGEVPPAADGNKGKPRGRGRGRGA